MTGIRRTDAAYKRATWAMLAVGLATFNGLYCTQALLPTFSEVFSISPTTAALTISAATGMLALCVVPASILSERFGRGRILAGSLIAATAVGLVIPFLSDPNLIIALRGLQGAFFAGTPAVAMAWLSEEIDARDLAGAMGLYIAGNAFGGLLGRIIPSTILEFASWRWAMGINAVFALTMAALVWLLLPAQQHFHAKQLHAKAEVQAMLGHWRNPRLAALFILPLLAMGTFVSVYNFLGFRMIQLFGLSEGLVGLLFIMYLAGTWSSARAGSMVKRWGRGPVVLSMALLMLAALPVLNSGHLSVILLALFIFTASFFALHSTASSWVGILATEHRAEASSMYLFCYYVGSSIIGWLSGMVMHIGWFQFTMWLSALTALIVLISAWLWSTREQSGQD
ncbi:MFS transporter [Corynebacterium sp. H128]|uniref:MFS transporter n=1 Tax=unclassified Corynebacterium TaxID=2624378 RepID=UPI0030B2A35D